MSLKKYKKQKGGFSKNLYNQFIDEIYGLVNPHYFRFLELLKKGNRDTFLNTDPFYNKYSKIEFKRFYNQLKTKFIEKDTIHDLKNIPLLYYYYLFTLLNYTNIEDLLGEKNIEKYVRGEDNLYHYILHKFVHTESKKDDKTKEILKSLLFNNEERIRDYSTVLDSEKLIKLLIEKDNFEDWSKNILVYVLSITNEDMSEMIGPNGDLSFSEDLEEDVESVGGGNKRKLKKTNKRKKSRKIRKGRKSKKRNRKHFF
jgi:hypothetical protein